jgi:hypothetical protein
VEVLPPRSDACWRSSQIRSNWECLLNRSIPGRKDHTPQDVSGAPGYDERASAVPGFGARAFEAVEPEEMAFAMTLFMGVASGQMASGLRDTNEPSSHGDCLWVLGKLSYGLGSGEGGGASTGRQRTLEEAFASLWHHYAADERRLDLCARVLGFYFLAQKNGGRILERWVSDSPDVPENVVLHPALVEALAVVPLTENGALPESLFFETVELIARECE